MNEEQISALIADLSKHSVFAELSHNNKDHSKANERLKRVLELAELSVKGYSEFIKIKNMKEAN